MLLFKRIVTLILIFRCTVAFCTCGTRVLITSKDMYVCVKPKCYVFIKINIIISLFVLMLLLNFSIVLFLYLFKMNLIENCMIETLKRIKDLCNIYCQKIVILYFMAVKLYLLFLP